MAETGLKIYKLSPYTGQVIENIVPSYDVDYWTTQGWSPVDPRTAPPAPPASGTTQTGTGSPAPGADGTTPPQNTTNDRYQFDGRYSLIKFTNDPTPTDAINDRDTIWLFDTQEKTYRPIVSLQALGALFPNISLDQALQKVQTLDSTVLNNATWQGTFIERKYGVQNDGTVPEIPSTAIGSKPGETNTEVGVYGAERNPTAEEETAKMIGVLFTTAKLSGGISEDTFNKYLSDPNGTLMSKYVSAALYGGYTFDDLWRDLKAKELADEGNAAYANIRGINENSTAEQWYKTADYRKAQGDITLNPPTDTMGLDPNLFKYSLFKIPGEAFKTLIPPIDWTKPEFQAEAEKIQAHWFDVVSAQAQAQTEQAKVIADHNYSLFKRDLKRKYGIDLSNNARDAWKQIQDMITGFGQRGLGRSGILDEAMDRYLTDVRRNDEFLRENMASEAETEFRRQLLTVATPEQLKAEIDRMNDEDRAKGIAPAGYRSVVWGLVPSEDTAKFFDDANLAKAYPDLTPEERGRLRGLLLDQFGNYRSELYQNLYANQYKLGQAKKEYQQNKLFAQKQVEESRAYAPYTSKNPFSSFQPDYRTSENKVQTTTGRTIDIPQQPPAGTSTPAPATQFNPNIGKDRPTTTIYKGGQSKVIDTADLDYWKNFQGWSTSAPTSGSYTPPAPTYTPPPPAPTYTPPPPAPAQTVTPPPAQLTNTYGQQVNTSSLPAGWTLGPNGKLMKL